MLSRSRAVLSLLQKSGIAASIAVFCAVSLHAQSTTQIAENESSSADYRFLLSSDDLDSLAPAPTPALHAQYGGSQGQYGQPSYQSRWSHLAVEGGFGFTAPVGNTTSELTYGWNFRGGLGWNFSKRLAMLGEYEFDRTGIPNAVLDEVGTPGGNVHVWSLTLDPQFKYKTGGAWGGYLTGGGGFYRRLTSFTEPVIAQGTYCNFFYCYPIYYQTTAVVSHYSSNQGGLNIGTGFTFGHWDHAQLFAEARYEWLDTPGHSTQIIPVTFGLRW